MRRLAVTLALLPAFACDPAVQEAPPTDAPVTTTTFDGVYAGGAGEESGRVLLQIEADVDPTLPSGSGDVRAFATLYSFAGTKRLIGSYDRASTALLLEGEGTSVDAYGSPQGFEGTYTGAQGPGVLILQQRSAALQIYCGTFTGSVAGIWDLVVSPDGQITGVVGPDLGDPEITHGNLQGTELTVAGSRGSSHGTLDHGQMHGSWGDGAFHGTFQGTTADCPVVP